jgi:hypothetical protein
MATNEFENSARSYFLQGLNVIPVKGKKPLIQWDKWQTERQNEKDFDELPWDQADGFAIIGGSTLNDGMYVCAIDFDVKNLPDDVVNKGREILNSLPVTQTEETPSHGQHRIFLSKIKPKTISAYHTQAALELLGDGKLIIMAPSSGYRKLTDYALAIVESLESLFYQTLNNAGFRHVKDNVVWFGNSGNEKAYEGQHPNCIQELLQGVRNGERNEIAIRLACYLANFRKHPNDKVWKDLLEWNGKNKAPLDEEELKRILESALKNNYVYGCSDSLLQRHCLSETCPLAKQTQVVPDEILTKEVERIFASDNIIEEIKRHLDNVIAGEDSNKLTIFILLLSGKLNDPSLKQMILLKGTEGSGKSTLMRIADFFKTKDVARFSQHALDYSDFGGYEILRLKELGSMDEEKQGISTIKFLSSDDKGYTIETTVKDKDTGRFSTLQHRIPSITVISSTTRIALDPQYLRRNWILNPDESDEQTEKILCWKASQEKEKTEVCLKRRQYRSIDLSKEILRCLVNKLDICTVVVPFSNTLIELFDNSSLRGRGDYDKVLAFVKLYCFLNQNKLPQKYIDGKKIVFATPKACIDALKIANQALAAMSTSLESRTQKLIWVLGNMEITTVGAEITKDKRDIIASKMGKSERTIRSYLSEWESVGYVSSDERKPKTYKLLLNLDDIYAKVVGISEKLKSADSLIEQMEKEAKELLGPDWKTEDLEIEKTETFAIMAVPTGQIRNTENGSTLERPKMNMIIS